MKKFIFQGLITLTLIFGIWYSLSQINWIKLLNINHIHNLSEEKLGEFIWNTYIEHEDINTDKLLNNSIDTIVNKICTANSLNCSNIKTHVINKDEVNAYVLPANHLVVYSGLIANTNDQNELSGVIAHEIAHIQLNHVMTSIIKEVGIGVLLSITVGNSSTEGITNLINTITSRAMSRNIEKEADMMAINYMQNAKISSIPLANFLNRLADKKDDNTLLANWFSTHPDTEERAAYIIEASKNKTEILNSSILNDATWKKIQSKIKVSEQ